MITREQIYSQEAAGLLRLVTTYRTLLEEQLYRFYPGKEDAVKVLLTQFTKQGRIFHNEEQRRFSANADCDEHMDGGMVAAVWVLLDFLDRAEYHTASDFPVKLCFIANGDLYEVIHVPLEQEVLLNHVVAEMGEDDARRIVLVDRPDQVGKLQIENTTGYCTVAPDGVVSYYKLE